MNNGRLNQDLALFTGCNIFGAGITLCALGCNLHGAIVAGYVVSGVSGWLLLASCCVGTCSDVVTDMQVVVARDVGPMVSGLVNGGHLTKGNLKYAKLLQSITKEPLSLF